MRLCMLSLVAATLPVVLVHNTPAPLVTVVHIPGVAPAAVHTSPEAHTSAEQLEMEKPTSVSAMQQHPQKAMLSTKVKSSSFQSVVHTEC